MSTTTTSDRPSDKTFTKRVIWSCKCGRKAFDYTATRRYLGTDKWGVKKWSEARLSRVREDGLAYDYSSDAFCPKCDRYRDSTIVNGRVGSHKCDARCTNATGSNCECQCGGKHHGAGWL